MVSNSIRVSPITTALGAEIEGVDLSDDLDDATIRTIRQALLDHKVIFFHDQHMTPEQHLALGRRFGKLNIHDYVEGMAAYPEIVEVRKEPEDERNFGGAWHTDVIYLEEPPLGSILYAKEVPECGGDTLWTNMELAYETLSDGMRNLLDGMRVMATPSKVYGPQSKNWRSDSSMKASPTDRATGEIEHPAIRTHPETGHRSLFVSGAFTPRFKDMTEEESAPLMDLLMTHATSEPFTCRFRWKAGDVAFWDNRCTMHYALNDYHGQRRVMHRVTVDGDRPY